MTAATNCPPAERSAAPPRRYDIDWLRIAAVLLLIPFHCARVFNSGEDFYIKNDPLSRSLEVFVAYVSPWHMSLLFMLAGCSTWLAMRQRSGRQYAAERVKRLLVPFVFGLVVIVPPQSWLGFITHDHPYQSFWSYYPQFWTTVDEDVSGYTGGFTPGHLWFILFLLLLALVALPLFLWMRNGSGRRVIDWVGRGAACRAAPLVLMLPAFGLMLAWAVAIETDVLVLSGQNPIGYFLLLVFGFVLVADARILDAVARHWRWLLPAGLAGMALMVTIWFDIVELPETTLTVYLVSDVLRCLAVWATMVGFVGLAQRYWNTRSRLWRYSAEAAYPFYILHQTVIVLLAYLVVQLGWGVPLKYALLVVASLAATLLSYDLLVRRWGPVRFLFGMKPARRD